MLTDLSQRDATALSFTTEYDPLNEMNISLWSNLIYGINNDNLINQSTDSLFIRKHFYTAFSRDDYNDQILI